MANLMFKKGAYAGLAAAAIQEGTVYVTTDERAMYVDIDATHRIRIGDFVSVSTQTELNDVTFKDVNCLYYVTSENILAKWDPTGGTNGTGDWVQINSQKQIKDYLGTTMNISANGTDKTTTSVAYGITGQNNVGTVQSGSMSFKSADKAAIAITGASNVVTFAGRNVDEAAKIAAATHESETNAVAIKVTTDRTGTNADGTSAAATVDGGSITLQGTNGTTVAMEDGKILIGGGGIKSVSTKATAAGIVVGVTPMGGNEVSSNALLLKVKYGKTGAQTTASFESDTVTLDTYTKAQVDTVIADSIKANNAMTFKGAVDQSSGLPTAQVSVGDTYKVIEEGTYGDQTNCLIGDMFIAKGTEGADGYITGTIEWVHIPTGMEEVVRGKLTYTTNGNGGWNLTDAFGNAMGGVQTGTGLLVTNKSSGNTRLVEIAHKAHAGTQNTDTAGVQDDKASFNFTVVSELTLENGHINSYKTRSITVKDTHNALNTYTFAGSVESGKAKIVDGISMTDGDSKSKTIYFTSDHMTMGASSTGSVATVTINLEWGSF